MTVFATPAAPSPVLSVTMLTWNGAVQSETYSEVTKRKAWAISLLTADGDVGLRVVDDVQLPPAELRDGRVHRLVALAERVGAWK